MSFSVLRNLSRNLRKTGVVLEQTKHLHIRSRKRFYKNVSVVQHNNHFEVNLDHRKLKTPLGSTFQVDSEPLALAVANEWMNQPHDGDVMLSQMHITGLSNTCLDNPGKATKEDLVKNILNFLETDTILFYGPDTKDPAGVALVELQRQKWSPIILWFRERYGVDVNPTQSISASCVSQDDLLKLERHLLSFSWSAINGLSFGVDAIKSLILGLAVLDRRVTVEEAVKLARLELNFQIDHWGNVDWAHDLEFHDTTARLAAGTIFTQLNNDNYKIKAKNIQA